MPYRFNPFTGMLDYYMMGAPVTPTTYFLLLIGDDNLLLVGGDKLKLV